MGLLELHHFTSDLVRKVENCQKRNDERREKSIFTCFVTSPETKPRKIAFFGSARVLMWTEAHCFRRSRFGQHLKLLPIPSSQPCYLNYTFNHCHPPSLFFHTLPSPSIFVFSQVQCTSLQALLPLFGLRSSTTNMFRCSSSSLFGGKYPNECGVGDVSFIYTSSIACCFFDMSRNATFAVQYNTQPGENVYVIGNARELGEWDVSKARKMTWNCGMYFSLLFSTYFSPLHTFLLYLFAFQQAFVSRIRASAGAAPSFPSLLSAFLYSFTLHTTFLSYSFSILQATLGILKLGSLMRLIFSTSTSSRWKKRRI